MRSSVAQAYDAKLAKLGNKIVLPSIEPWAHHVYWMYTIVLGDDVKASRDEVMARMDAQGIETRPVFYPMHVMPPYFEEGASYPNAEHCAGRGINLPTHGMLSEQDIDRVVAALQHAID